MPVKQIVNASQAFTTGASWGNAAYENEGTDSFVPLLNGAGVTLYTGDLVSLDVTGTQAILPTAAADLSFVGVVGTGIGGDLSTSAAPASIGTFIGGNQPMTDSPARTDTGVTLTNASATVLDTAAQTADFGKTLILPLASGNQIVTVIAVTAGTGFTISANYTGTTAATYSISVIMSPSALAPGWVPLSIVPGAIVPVIQQGFCRVNITGLTTFTAKSGILTTTNASVVATYTATGSATAAQGLGNLVIPLEAYAARDLTLTNLGLAGHETVRGWIP